MKVERCKDCGVVASRGAVKQAPFAVEVREGDGAIVAKDTPCARRGGHGEVELLELVERQEGMAEVPIRLCDDIARAMDWARLGDGSEPYEGSAQQRLDRIKRGIRDLAAGRQAAWPE